MQEIREPWARIILRSAASAAGLESATAKGAWLADQTTFVVYLQTPGNDDLAKIALTFTGRGVDVSITSMDGFSLVGHGEADD